MPVYQGSHVIGYVYFTDDILPIPAYSGKPIRTLVALNLVGKIVGIDIVQHEEPILVVGVSEKDLRKFTEQYTGHYSSDKIKVGGRKRDGYHVIDTISGATITVMVLNATITRSMQKVALSRGLVGVSYNTKQQAMDKEVPPIWLEVWRNQTMRIGVLSVGLFALLVLLVLQDWFARRAKLLEYVRIGYLLYTVFFIGWYALAQLSVVNVITFVKALLSGFHWDNFLMDPLMFLLWGFVAMTILLWGRGVYCGWLCPFGALQELLFRVARWLRLPTIEFPDVVHERLWAIKYILLLGLFGLSMQSLVLAEKWAEVEPFKTTFVLQFNRELVFLSYAILLLVISMFMRKFYCRYLCTLGAALTFPSKFRIFSWLRRHKECGRPCQICREECEVRAISQTGEINHNECHYCLDCQTIYWNVYKCPPVVAKRKKQQRFATNKTGLT